MSATIHNLFEDILDAPLVVETDAQPEEEIVTQVEIPKMTIAECQVETQKHIENVRKYIRFLIESVI